MIGVAVANFIFIFFFNVAWERTCDHLVFIYYLSTSDHVSTASLGINDEPNLSMISSVGFPNLDRFSSKMLFQPNFHDECSKTKWLKLNSCISKISSKVD